MDCEGLRRTDGGMYLVILKSRCLCCRNCLAMHTRGPSARQHQMADDGQERVVALTLRSIREINQKFMPGLGDGRIPGTPAPTGRGLVIAPLPDAWEPRYGQKGNLI